MNSALYRRYTCETVVIIGWTVGNCVHSLRHLLINKLIMQLFNNFRSVQHPNHPSNYLITTNAPIKLLPSANHIPL